MLDIFITSTLHSDWNLVFNPKLCTALEEQGIKCYLPQRDTDQKGSRIEKFQQNIKSIHDSSIVLGVSMNETPNVGIEIGFAHGIGKPVIILTDKKHEIPLMAEGTTTNILRVSNLEATNDYIEELLNLIKLKK